MRGYVQIGAVRMEPDSVLVSGPESLIADIHEISTTVKRFENLIREVKGHVELEPPPWETVHYTAGRVRFEADIQRLGERVLKNLPIQVTHVPANIKEVKVVPSTLTMTVRGGVKILAQLKPEDIKVTIDYRTQRRVPKRAKAVINIQENLDFTDVRPQFFELVVER
jgi:YbbR domain-containing protein